MKDERVRPQQRRKTKIGWVTSYSKNGADHMKMEGVTFKAGELFDLGGGVKAKAPSQSGVAAHDCLCRCFLEYNLMTAEEFAKATGKTVEYVKKKTLDKYNEKCNVILEKYNVSLNERSEGNITPITYNAIENVPKVEIGGALVGKGKNIFVMHNHPRNGGYFIKGIALRLRKTRCMLLFLF